MSDLLERAKRLFGRMRMILGNDLSPQARAYSEDSYECSRYILNNMFEDDSEEIDGRWLTTLFKLGFNKRESYTKYQWTFYPRCGELVSFVTFEGWHMLEGNVTRGQVRQLIKLFNISTLENP